MDQKKKRTSSDVRAALDDRAHQIEKHLGALRREVSGMVPPVKDIIVKHPIGSACAVLGAGVVLGYLIGGGRREGGSGDGALLDAVLAPVVESIKERLNNGETSEEAVRGALRTYVVPQRASALNELFRLLLPMAVEMSLKALDKDGEEEES
ncbi:MAG: hypothetical protein F4065_11400 [Rhodothermaceae bacterium]|nr:hypothetical protein [Bacteroidota bacterium]MXW15477.1 hypothetical protein [Rhodothermaceae bacterium]MDE2645209.1 hypothetical protein [Bacteroidota bacterium]MXW32131.1 hypothetical protein [Rhodothermaceae bacterium]MXX96926.1 hypothetical protein [Rhodothermaceae bacterium]